MCVCVNHVRLCVRLCLCRQAKAKQVRAQRLEEDQQKESTQLQLLKAELATLGEEQVCVYMCVFVYVCKRQT